MRSVSESGPPNIGHFLTGDETTIHKLSKDGFVLLSERSKEPNPPAGQEFDHATKLAVVDKDGNIRDYFDGFQTDTDADGSRYEAEMKRPQKNSQDPPQRMTIRPLTRDSKVFFLAPLSPQGARGARPTFMSGVADLAEAWDVETYLNDDEVCRAERYHNLTTQMQFRQCRGRVALAVGTVSTVRAE